MLNARAAVSPRLVLAQTTQRISKNYAAAAHSQAMPRGHVGIVGAPRRCLPPPYPVIYQATLLPHAFFFMQVTKSHPHHDYIYSSTHRLWRSSGTCAFIVVFSSCCASCFHYHLSLLFTFSHTPTFCRILLFFFRLEHGSEPLDSSHRSLRGIAQCPLATCCLYVLP